MGVWDDLWAKARIVSGACTSSMAAKDLEDYLAKGEQYTRYAAQAGYFLNKSPDAVQKLESAADALGKVRSGVGAIRGRCSDASALVKIHSAMKILNNPQNLQQGSEVAARAFGDLFVGAGWFAAKLPPPANVYAQILENCGDFFVNMQRLLDPMKRPGGQGRQMREVWSGFERGEY